MGADKREDDLCLRVFSLNEDQTKYDKKIRQVIIFLGGNTRLLGNMVVKLAIALAYKFSQRVARVTEWEESDRMGGE